MRPVLPAFAGYVPDEFIKIYPNVSYSISPSWSNFVEPYGYVVLLEPVDPMFSKVASLFIQEQIYPFLFILLLNPSLILISMVILLTSTMVIFSWKWM